jgi:selenide,water dikinase
VELAQKGYAPGASGRNWASYGHDVALPETMVEWQKNMLCDPQTSGGLLVSCKKEVVAEVLAVFAAQGFEYAQEIGQMVEGKPVVTVK